MKKIVIYVMLILISSICVILATPMIENYIINKDIIQLITALFILIPFCYTIYHVAFMYLTHQINIVYVLLYVILINNLISAKFIDTGTELRENIAMFLVFIFTIIEFIIIILNFIKHKRS